MSSKGNDVVEEYVDLIELNHFYDQQGRHVYDQVIFYERTPDTGRFQVRAWCLVEDRDALNRRPVKNSETQRYQVDWLDNDQRLMRKITSHLYRESWSQIDPERANKKIYDERLRVLLVQNPKKIMADRLRRQIEEAKQAIPENAGLSNVAADPTANHSPPTVAHDASTSTPAASLVQR